MNQNPLIVTQSPHVRILLLLVVAAFLLIWSIDSIWSTSVDIAHHYALVARLSEFWTLPIAKDPSLQEMMYYPRGSHLLAALAGSVFNSPLIGIQLVTLVSIIVAWAGLVFIVLSLPAIEARKASVVFIVLLILNRTLVHTELHATEVIGNFCFSQLVGQALTILLVTASLYAERCGMRVITRYLIVIPAVYVIALFHLLPAVELLGFLAALIGIEIVVSPMQSKFDRVKRAVVGLSLICAATAIVVFHPSFAAMKEVSDNDGSLPLAHVASMQGLGLLCLVVAAIAGIMLFKWIKLGTHESRMRLAAFKYAGLYGISISGLCLLQILALKLGHGSEYAARKYAFGLYTILLLSCALLSTQFIKNRKSRSAAIDQDERSWFHFYFLPPLIIVIAFFSVVPSNKALDASDIVSLERQLQLLRDIAIPGIDGKYNYITDLNGIPPVISYMFTTGILKAPRTENAFDVLRNKRFGKLAAIGTIITSKNAKLYDIASCRRFVTASSLVLLDGDCIAKSWSKIHTYFDFTIADGTRGCTLQGFSHPDDLGRWTDGKSASFACKVVTPEGKRPTTVLIDTTGFVYHGRPQRALISINGAPSVEYRYERDETQKVITAPFPKTETGEIHIDFSLPEAISPKEVGLNADTRTIGISVRSIEFE